MLSLGTIIKLTVSVLLFVWLITSGALDISKLDVFTSNISLVLIAMAFWLIGPILLASLRWKYLLNAAGFSISWIRTIRLQLIGVFFTSAMPGSLGGDVVKVFYLIGDNPKKSKSLAFWSILFDRIIGMCGLFTIGAIFILTNFSELWAHTSLRPLFLMVFGYILAFILLLIALKIAPPKRKSESGEEYYGFKKYFQKIFSFFAELRIFRNKFKTILIALFLSVCAHFLSFIFFASLSLSMSNNFNNLPELATIFPIGMLITTLPLAPGGFGVGHFAFEELFSIVDLANGANVFNAYFFSQLILNLTGVLSYLSTKKKPKNISRYSNTTEVR